MLMSPDFGLWARVHELKVTRFTAMTCGISVTHLPVMADYSWYVLRWGTDALLTHEGSGIEGITAWGSGSRWCNMVKGVDVSLWGCAEYRLPTVSQPKATE
jgi:hypothetical protein